MALLDGQHVQRIRQDEPVVEPVADSLAGACRCRRFAAADGAQERLRLVAVVLRAPWA
jgi:hypothetical protein